MTGLAHAQFIRLERINFLRPATNLVGFLGAKLFNWTKIMESTEIQLRNQISSLEREVKRQKGIISFLESTAGKIVNDEDIQHESLKYINVGLRPNLLFKVAIDWYRTKLTGEK